MRADQIQESRCALLKAVQACRQPAGGSLPMNSMSTTPGGSRAKARAPLGAAQGVDRQPAAGVFRLKAPALYGLPPAASDEAYSGLRGIKGRARAIKEREKRAETTSISREAYRLRG